MGDGAPAHASAGEGKSGRFTGDAQGRQAKGAAARPATLRRLPLLLRRAWFSLNQAFRRRIAHLDLTPDQYTVLRNLIEARPARLAQRDLCRLMSSDPNTVASLLERMEEARLVRRLPDPDDRRARRVQLTARGTRRFGLARQVALALEAEVLGCLEPSAREGFLRDFERVAETCRQATLEASSLSR